MTIRTIALSLTLAQTHEHRLVFLAVQDDLIDRFNTLLRLSERGYTNIMDIMGIDAVDPILKLAEIPPGVEVVSTRNLVDIFETMIGHPLNDQQAQGLRLVELAQTPHPNT